MLESAIIYRIETKGKELGMATIEQVMNLKTGDVVSLDLSSLALSFMSTDEWDGYKKGGMFALDDGKLLHFEESDEEYDNPYIGLDDHGAIVAWDGEDANVVSNENNEIMLFNEDSEAEFSFDYGMACAALNVW